MIFVPMVLFREYCFRRKDSLSFRENWVSSTKQLGEFAFAHRSEAERNSLSSLPGIRRGEQNSLSSDIRMSQGALG